MFVYNSYRKKKMDSISIPKPQHGWTKNVIRSSAVGPVGDTMTTWKLKGTLPGEYRYSPGWSPREAPLHGSNVQDGYSHSYISGGGPGRLHSDRVWNGSRTTDTPYGWVHSDIKPVARTTFAENMGKIDRTQDMIDQTRRQFTTNLDFPIPPGGLIVSAGGITRGNNAPRVTRVFGHEGVIGPSDAPEWGPRRGSGNMMIPGRSTASYRYGPPTRGVRA